jgi:hypothetical protein
MKSCLFAFVLIAAITTSVLAKPPHLKFIENKNQWNCNVDFATQVSPFRMELKRDGFSFYLLDHKKIDELHHLNHLGTLLSEEGLEPMVEGVFISTQFVGSYAGTPHGIQKSEEYYNYFLGSDPEHWASAAYAYDAVLYPHLYEGIDLKVYSHGDNPKYDLIVAPGADPSQIRIDYDGIDRLFIDDGDLHATTALGDIIEKSPIAWQIIQGEKRFVKCEFIISGRYVGFVFPDGFDSCYELTIDPILIFSTYSGSAADNWGSTATPGENGTLYSSGITNHFSGNVFSGTFPATPGSFQTNYGGLYDIAILKYDSLGKKVLYASYLGGGQSESPHSLVVNKDNELIVLGTTSSLNFPVSQTAVKKSFSGGDPVNTVFLYASGCDMIVSRISPDGKTLLASTFLGGSENDGINFLGSELRKNYGDDLRGDVITDDEGNIYISSVTASDDVGAMNEYNGGITDAVIVSLPADLSAINWATYVGGTGTDAAHSIKFDSDQNIVAAGGTTSVDFPVTSDVFQTSFSGIADGWIAKISSNGTTILNATYTGSFGFDQVYFLDLNTDDEVYVYGQTDSPREITPGVFGQPNSGQFLQKFSPTLSEEKFYTVFGTGKGSPDISPTAFLVNSCNNLYMAGWGGSLNSGVPGAFETTTTGLEVTADAWQKTTAGHDFYFLVLSADAEERLYATFLGGNLSNTHVDGGTSRFDKQGVVYHAVCAGCRGNDDFPTTPGVVSRTNNSTNCNNAAFKFDLSSLKALVSIRGSDKVCLPDKAFFENNSIGGEKFFWNFGDGSPVQVQNDPAGVSHEYKAPGVYTVWLKAYDPGTCIVSDSVSVKVFVDLAAATIPEDASICEGESHTFAASGGTTYEWRSKDGKYSFDTPSITVSPVDSTLFYINVFEPFGCVTRDSVWLGVTRKVNPDFTFERDSGCDGGNPALLLRNTTVGVRATDHIFFDFGDGTTGDEAEQDHYYTNAGKYTVKIVTERDGCVEEKAQSIAVGRIKFPNVITPGGADGLNDVLRVQFGDNEDTTPSDAGMRVSVAIYDRWGRPVYQNDDYKSDWSASDVSGGVYYYEVFVEQHQTCKGWIHVVK